MNTKWKWLIALMMMIFFASACANNQTEDVANNEDTSETPAAQTPVENEEPIDDAVETKAVVLYFSDDQLMHILKVEREVATGEDETDLIQNTLDQWREGPVESSLQNLVPPGTDVRYLGEEDGVATVSFSDHIYDANLGSTGEAALVDQVAMMMEQFGYEETQILVEGEVVETLLGHMQLNVPIEAGHPDQFDWYH